ncbi:MAG: zinc-binding dehydrogenase [Candidatus Rokubacteria bacterium]|nr:zinc-binding dehydrogenase [Candidatus Rokubacteria bacterium]
MGGTVRAAVLVNPKTIELREFARPAIGPDDALLRIEACGICGSDYEQYEGAAPPHEDYTQYPVVPGHEPLGLIEEIGARARERWSLREGDRVAVRSGYGCGRCTACGRFETRACRTRGGTYGYTDVSKPPHLWGGYAEHMYLCPHSVLKKMDPRIPAGVAVMFNPLAAGLSWAGSVPATGPGDRVVILGAGQRGLCCVIAARAAGARQIVITGLSRDAHKLALARELGADVTINAETEDVVASVREATGGGAEVVVDTTPYSPESLGHAVAIAVRKGRIVVAGLKGQRPARELPVDDVIYKELTIRGVLSMPVEDTFRAVDLIESGRHPLEKMHTHSFPIEQAEDAIHALVGAVPGLNPVHVAIVPGAPPVSLRAQAR